MTTTLKSYLCGQWVTGSGTPSALVNPTTEETVAESSTEGFDFAAGLDYARKRGGPALRKMSFEQRGELLRRSSKVLHERREELIELAVLNGGNTRGDAKFDIDGATLTLAFYGRLGKTLGDRRILVDGDLEQLGRNPRFVGAHVYTPLQGAAVHINAFNFPAWGFAEKAACALLAGMPVITKPATSTAMVTVRMVEILIEQEVLPAGTLSLIAGRPGDLLSRLGSQDVIGFTGSADTGAWIRGRENVVQQSIRVNIEADSLNAAVLGPDVDTDSETYDFFLREVVREMTQKAGQKCTAIRRVFVPEGLLDQVGEDISEQLLNIPVGNPALREVRMGPLATRAQRQDIIAGIKKLRGCSELVFGDGGPGKRIGVEGDSGFFVAPVLLRASDPASAVAVHNHEVFGPVVTLMAYGGDAQEASHLVQLGNGGLVSSVYTDDQRFTLDMLMGLAPFHGRLQFGSAKIASHSSGHGTVLPGLIHGGPGRAGGGEELGGERGLAFYMQRTAIQGSRPILEKALGL
jgi:oxepin-CoA hydrolase/3-oxo-5,6-dehydrosuberyl-CoA semialdehyde dehydrogenase